MNTQTQTHTQALQVDGEGLLHFIRAAFARGERDLALRLLHGCGLPAETVQRVLSELVQA